MNILIVIPKNQFDEAELFDVKTVFEEARANVVVLSPSGQEAVGENKTRVQPDGYLIDWNHQPGFSGKYAAIAVIGGKGSPKSLWQETILPQILTDHHRAGSVIGGIGQSVVVLAKTGLIRGSAAVPDDEKTRAAVVAEGVGILEDHLVRLENIVTAKGAVVAKEFAETILSILNE
jgi:putative intracellular protease/amidase